MNPLFQRLMNEATRLTRHGSLQDATAAIQRALRRDRPPAAPPEASARASTHVAAEVVEADVIEAEVRVRDEAPARAKAQTETEFAYVEPADVVATPDRAERWLDGRFVHAGRTLAYKLYLPPSSATTGTASPPLVLMLHGCTQNPDDFAAGTQMNTLARAQGVAVLYPAQTRHENAQGCWNWFKTQHQQRGRGEPDLLAALTRSVLAEHGLDPARVYVAGLSAGGAMADILGRAYPDLFAAVGVHSGLPTGAASDVMSALGVMRTGPAAAPALASGQRMPPLIVFHGDADTTVDARNGAAVVAAAIGTPPAAGQRTDGVSTSGLGFTRTDYPAGAQHNAVEHWQLHGGGHAWSGGSSAGSFTEPAGVDASAAMLRFFLAHPRTKV